MVRRMSAPLFTLVLTGLLFPVGCTWGLGGGGETPPMHRSFSRSVDIQTGLVQGDLDQIRSAAAWILQQGSPVGAPASAAKEVEAMEKEARDLSTSGNLGAAAGSAGRLAASCGGCHVATGGGPRFVVGTEAPGGSSQEAHMIRHLWAADRMWEGLVGPSDEAWKAGAEALSETDPGMMDAIRAEIPPDALEGFLAGVGEAGRRALEAKARSERAEAYSGVVQSCTQCHGALGVPIQR